MCQPTSVPGASPLGRKPPRQRILLDSGHRHHVVTDHLGARGGATVQHHGG